MKENEFKRIVEINGVKIEIDLRTAKRVDSFTVGQPVKLLKKAYGDSFTAHPGVIVGFDEFQNRPTICIAYLEENYSDVGIKFEYINKDTKDSELAPMQDWEKKVNKASALKFFDKEIEKHEREIELLQNKKKFFEDNYSKYFESVFSGE